MVNRVSIQNILSTVYQKALHTPWVRTTSVALLALGAVALIFRSQIQKCLFTPNYDDLPALVTALKARAATAHRSISDLSPFRIGKALGSFQAIALMKTTNVNAIADQAFHDSVPAMVVNTIPTTLDAPENYLPGSALALTQASRIILPPEILDRSCVKYSIRESNRPIYHLNTRWELGALTNGVVGLIQEAAQAINTGKTVLFHYQPGNDSSVYFLALMLFACKKEKLRTVTDTDRIREMVAILKDVANQGRLLYPTERLLRQLLNPVYLEKIIFNPPTPSKPATATDLANWLAGAAAIGKMEESFEPFTFETSKGGYIVKGFGSVRINDTDTAELETHLRRIRDSRADHVVNLIHPEEKNYLASPLLMLKPSAPASTKLYKFENGKTLYNFIDWPDGGWVKEGTEEALLYLVKMTANLVNGGKIVFVHCHEGSQRTAIFLALVELFQKRRTMQDLPEANLHNELFKILLEFTKFKKSRPPTPEQLDRLMNYEFLKKLVS